jgi:hypothetical protein
MSLSQLIPRLCPLHLLSNQLFSSPRKAAQGFSAQDHPEALLLDTANNVLIQCLEDFYYDIHDVSFLFNGTSIGFFSSSRAMYL